MDICIIYMTTSNTPRVYIINFIERVLRPSIRNVADKTRTRLNRSISCTSSLAECTPMGMWVRLLGCDLPGPGEHKIAKLRILFALWRADIIKARDPCVLYIYNVSRQKDHGV